MAAAAFWPKLIKAHKKRETLTMASQKKANKKYKKEAKTTTTMAPLMTDDVPALIDANAAHIAHIPSNRFSYR